MSCNGCRVLRKGCSESCVLRTCLKGIDTPDAQGHATVFVAKFFGRAGLMSFVSAVPESQRPALFQSLLYEACGRTINPMNGAVGLLWTGNWHLCQTAVETVLQGGTLRPLQNLDGVVNVNSRRSGLDADLCLTPRPTGRQRRPGTPSDDGSVTTSVDCESSVGRTAATRPRLLNLFV